MKKFSKIIFILFLSFSIYPKAGSGKKLPRPSISPLVSPTPTPTPSGVMSSAPFIL